MIMLLLSCSKSYCQTSLSTGVTQYKVSIDTIRIINTKLVEAKIAKQQIVLYKELTNNQKITISELKQENINLTEQVIEYDSKIYSQKLKTRFWFGSTCGLGLVVIVLILL